MLLQESHVNYGTFAPANSGSWTNSNVNFNGIDFPAVNQGDILYVRAYNLPESDWMAAGSSKELGIANSQGEIVSQLVGRTDIPQGYAFPDLKTQPIPEPATLLLLAPGLALWAIRRKK
ncbi:MAG: PEP-CTERM sorting domain-containing protein [bacterium]|nr:PEP-CTERM sorting domain-containing protein [bacterium]